jgi:hypothetical protein
MSMEGPFEKAIFHKGVGLKCFLFIMLVHLENILTFE